MVRARRGNREPVGAVVGDAAAAAAGLGVQVGRAGQLAPAAVANRAVVQAVVVQAVVVQAVVQEQPAIPNPLRRRWIGVLALAGTTLGANPWRMALAASPLAGLPPVRSGAVLVVDSTDGAVIFAKNAQSVQPIASITKLMTALVVLDGQLDLNARIEITEADKSTVKFSRSRLLIGTVATRRELLRVALMASDNRAAAALARTYPGGTEAALAEMNRKARVLGLVDTRFDDPTGLSAGNVSTAVDLARLIVVARRYPEIREFSTSANATIRTPRGDVVFGNTNGLTHSKGWEIDLSKTGFIAEAGRCLVLHTKVGSRWMSMVLLDAAGRYTAIADAQRLRQWLEPKAAPSRAAKKSNGA